MASLDRPQDNQLAFVLHSYPYRETSLIVETFTQKFGRVALQYAACSWPSSR